MTKEILDQAARDKIKSQLRTNFLVEAGAGSGKTTSLVDRMVNLIYTGTAQIQEIVAITFTRKAADELKVRFQARLEEVWKNEKEFDIKFLLGEALQNIERCFLGTVHAFCAKLLRERPIDANLDLTFTELEEADDIDILEEAWQSYLQTLMDEEAHRFEIIEELGITVDNLFPWLKGLKEYSDVEWVTETRPKPELGADYQSFMLLIKEAKSSVPEEEPIKGYDSLQKAILTAVQKERFINPEKEKDIISILELFDKNLKPTYNRWPSKEDAKFYEEKITAVFEVSIKPLIQAWKEYCHPKIIRFLEEAVQAYQHLKRERSLLNFQDLMIHTSKLLKGNREVRAYFQAKYRYLLVDEFQDTDPIQAEIMFYLTSEDINEKIWTRCKPKAGSLFVVGDPKQAIYRFRRADIDTYNRVKQLIEEHGGEVLQLTTNFRSLDTVTKELNKVFQKHLPEVESDYQAAYRPLIAYHENTGAGFTGIKRLSIPSDYKKKEEVILIDAENIARSIQHLIRQGHQAKDFMVLTRYTDGVAVYAKMIEDMGIPVSISGEVILGETREFQDLWILLKSFLDTTDEVGFIAVLRGIFFGISDQELYQWRQAGGRFSIYANIPSEISPEVSDKFRFALEKLQGCQKLIRTLSPTAAIERIIEEVGFYPLLLKNGRNKRTYKSLLQMLEALRKQEAAGKNTYKQVMEVLTELIFEKTVVVNLEEEADAVRIMNIHKAKGLEAPIVFLAHPSKSVSPESFLSQYIKREDHASKGYFTFTVKNGYANKEIAIPLEWVSYKAEELKYLTEEELRIIYVAATRAEQALIISSHAGNKKNPWNILFEMENIEEMELPEVEAFKMNSKSEVITLSEFQAKTVSKNAWLDQSKLISFEHWSPTKDKDYSELLTIERESGGGKDWGTLIHDVFEKAVQGYELSYYIKVSLSNYKLPIEREKEVTSYLQNFQNSLLWEELMTADEVLTEVPFTLKVEKGQALYSLITKNPEDKHPFYVKGTIDLIYKKNGSWNIVDYKTDRAKKVEDYEKLQAFYRSQLSFYKHAWEELTEESVSKELLYFLEPNKIMAI
ncbi:UvrD-helicase domain-containing protein [Neobacillus drentensis]|uniref:UvrD-helicase domain-containing protein n=1 Tax=Neobacillus drentensis TaxID=220684 RepID=UPI00286349A8|nr:UvrD-helicase domain-containing protein [Neobacillus drentensis]MDR7240120.1 ATP-dependent helicase/nuclease subunit A [Neobacillus drentensis]